MLLEYKDSTKTQRQDVRKKQIHLTYTIQFRLS